MRPLREAVPFLFYFHFGIYRNAMRTYNTYILIYVYTNKFPPRFRLQRSAHLAVDNGIILTEIQQEIQYSLKNNEMKNKKREFRNEEGGVRYGNTKSRI